MWVLSLLLGSETESWYARFALRSRVSMSATGSVIVISWFPVPCGFGAGPPTSDLLGVRGLGARGRGGAAGCGLFRLEGEAERAQQSAALVVRLGGGHDRDVEAAHAVDLILIDLVEDRLLGHTEGVVAVAVVLLRA